MKEQNKAERADILGIGMDDLRVDRAVNLTSHYLEKNKFEHVMFVNTKAALKGQDQEEFQDFARNAAMVLPGDNNIEHAVGIGHFEEQGTSYQVQYFKRLFQRLNRQRAVVYVLMKDEEGLDLVNRIIGKNYDRVELGSTCWSEEDNVDSIVNEINIQAPDVLIICADYERICRFLKENRMKINAGICICAEEMATGENYGFPEWIRMLGLEKAYIHLYKKPLAFWHNKLFHQRMKEQDMEQEESKETLETEASDESC